MNLERFQHDSSMGLTLVMEKHGTGDQKPHGSWATGVKPEVAQSIQQFTREWGGLSISMVDGSMPTGGYMVSKPPSFGKVVDEADFFDPIKGPKILSQYMREQKADLATGKNYLGTWLNGGKVFLDVSENIMDVNKATRLGRKHDQIKIWDVVNQVEIDTGGSGGVQKESEYGSVEESGGNDRRGDRRLRAGNLVKVGKALKVIRFAAGLKPVFKHEGGGHDQKKHGSWANQGYSDEEAERIARMENVGPSLEDLQKFVDGQTEILEDDLIQFVENDQGFYEAAVEGIEERVSESISNLQAEFPNHEYSEQEKSEIFDNVSREMIAQFVDENTFQITNLVQEGRSDEVGEKELTESFADVYAMEITGTGRDGQTHTLTSSVDNVTLALGDYGDAIEVRGSLKNENDDDLSDIVRTFERDENGNWEVEHDYLIIEDEDYRGTGFGKEFLRQSEDWYTATGIASLKVGTAQEGAVYWARRGFDFDERSNDNNFAKLPYAFPQDNVEFVKLMNRAVNDYDSVTKTFTSVKPMTTPGFPTPAEFALIGYTEGATDWTAARSMYGLNLKYRKGMTAEGRSLITPTGAENPIDRDGDGLVFDGTSRERPAPKG